MSGDMMSTVTNKRRCEAVPADDVDIKEEPSNPKTPPLELEVYQAAGPVHASDVSASLQAHAFGSSKNKDIGTRKPTDCDQMFRAISVKNAWVFDAKKVLSKSRPSVLANVPSRMTFVDWHGQCFDSTTYVDRPRCHFAALKKRRNKKAQTQTIALTRPALEKRCIRMIDFVCRALSSPQTFSAFQVPITKVVAGMGGVRRFLEGVFNFVYIIFDASSLAITERSLRLRRLSEVVQGKLLECATMLRAVSFVDVACLFNAQVPSMSTENRELGYHIYF